MLVIFDLDDTLIDTLGSVLPAKLENVMNALIQGGLAVKERKRSMEELLRLNNSAKNTRSAISEFLEINGFSPEFMEIADEELLKDDFQELMICESDGATDTISYLARDHKLGIVTAGKKEFQLKKIHLAKIPDKLFNRIVVCSSKEKGKYYQEFLKDFQCSPNEVVVCGDRVKQDLSPAKVLGMTTIHIRQGRGLAQSSSDLDVDYTIYSLDQLLDVLEKIEGKNQLGKL